MSRARDLFERIKQSGMSAIDALIEDRASEELFLDFKEASKTTLQSSLPSTDGDNLSKAISGFGNSEGGLLVWGVRCAPGKSGADVATEIRPLEDAQGFRSQLEGVVSRLTIPPHATVEHHVIPIAGSERAGLVATLIPKSPRAPHRAETGHRNYYIRAGSSFVPISHDALAGLFGRPPFASLDLSFVPHLVKRNRMQEDQRMTINFGLGIENTGAVLADRAFIALRWDNDNRLEARASLKATGAYAQRESGRVGVQAVAQIHASLPPNGIDHVLDCALTVPDGSDQELEIRATIGAQNCPPRIIRITALPDSLRAALEGTRKGAEYPTNEVIVIRTETP